ncbi:NYN domain-containing protein [Flavobacterium sp.]|uniref:NYN domain-containing protein n=1 Tax=Flavobacterium sp. TaxID=239 RepID=UPI002B4ACF65|nr:NYN domain-containing protein [Flavobacterium sp.]HLP63112.1 NYN domain-containing protein [Flavobacterium sp.]
METKFNIAVLIDGDNAQPKLLQAIIEEVSKYGKATIRRIYGDWTTVQMNGWKEIINQYSFNPIQKFSYTTGKNSTDSSLIIDAMDILHEKNVHGFCIVSSDSDYTGLAKRIREQGVFVMGIGRKSTPIAFIQSCEIFTFCENISPEVSSNEEQKKVIPKPKAKAKKQVEVKKEIEIEKPIEPEKVVEKDEIDTTVIDKAFDISVGEEEEVHIAQIGLNLRKLDPSFDSRAFGYKNLTRLFENLPNYIVIRNDVNGLNHPIVKRK